LKSTLNLLPSKPLKFKEFTICSPDEEVTTKMFKNNGTQLNSLASPSIQIDDIQPL